MIGEILFYILFFMIYEFSTRYNFIITQNVRLSFKQKNFPPIVVPVLDLGFNPN